MKANNTVRQIVHLLPKSAAEIDKALSWLRWREAVGCMWLGVFATFIPGFVLRDRLGSDLALLAPMVAGALLGFSFFKRHWRKRIERHCDSFLRLDSVCLEIKGVVPDGCWHVRVHLDQIASIQIGESRIAGALSPLVAAFDSTTLFIHMKDGSSARFLMVGLLYNQEELAALFSALESKLAFNESAESSR